MGATGLWASPDHAPRRSATDKLRAGLSGAEPAEGEPAAAELAERIKAMQAENTVEAAPARVGSRSATRAERPVAARILERTEEKPEAAEAPEPDKAAVVIPIQPPAPVKASDNDAPNGNVIEMPPPVKPTAPSHTQQVMERRNPQQLSLF